MLPKLVQMNCKLIFYSMISDDGNNLCNKWNDTGIERRISQKGTFYGNRLHANMNRKL